MDIEHFHTYPQLQEKTTYLAAHRDGVSILLTHPELGELSLSRMSPRDLNKIYARHALKSFANNRSNVTVAFGSIPLMMSNTVSPGPYLALRHSVRHSWSRSPGKFNLSRGYYFCFKDGHHYNTIA